jgi:exodeoxyribonuclease VII small subunit
VIRKPRETGFEAALAELEQLVARMEGGDLPLDEALKGFERGVQLTRECQSALQAAQQKVQILLQKPSGAAAEDFAAPADEAAGAADVHDS